MRFIPKEEKFFDLFDELAGRIEAGGKLFLDMVENGTYSESQTARLKEIEQEADIITAAIKYSNAGSMFPGNTGIAQI